ncbi:putative copper-importing P-type ATPase A [Gimesia alba]|uniref:Putative copper-importing P-type ATPase A n=2 Tax=Gimesia alba TaxID=2527973 RepID=A0A517RG72_9PLAN|nr:putative copper-importing P-type ATPase A [Gimesia alba]
MREGFTPLIEQTHESETTSQQQQGTCIHCNLPVPTSRQTDEQPWFCCAGCEVAYAILQDMDACLLEELNNSETVPSSDLSYEEMDHPRFRELYAHEIEPGLFRIRFHLEGMHCASCVFVIEKLPDFLPGVISARVNLTNTSVDLIWDSASVSLSEIARTLDRLGYRPHPPQHNDAEQIYQRENRKYLIRLGIAGACAGNVMLIAFALYAGMFTGMAAEHLNLFRWTSAALALVSIVWPGHVFFKGAFSAIKTRSPHIDLPVALGITIGGVAGLINSLRGTGEIYFDSLTVLIFLLLVGRYIQFRQQHRALSHLSLLKSITPRSARLISNDEVATVPIEVLKAGDQVEVRAGDVIPADGVVYSGDSTVDESILTGEARPRIIQTGAQVTAGTINLTSPIRLDIECVGENTRIGRLMNLVELGVSSKLPLLELANRIAGIFVLTVIVLAIVCLGIWWSSGVKIAVSNSISLLIVTCPCALGLATPLALAVAQGKAAKRAILINSGDVIERLSKPGLLWLDKTGTLTYGKMQVHEWHGDRSFFPQIRAMEQQVVHPIASALTTWIDQQIGTEKQEFALRDIDYSPGLGIRGALDGTQFAAGSETYITEQGGHVPLEFQQKISEYRQRGLTAVIVVAEGETQLVLGIGDDLRPDAAATIQKLKTEGWSVGILSGDHSEIVTPIASRLNIDPELVHAAVRPEEKLKIIQESTRRGITVMVGDGVNDSAALAAASVGIAVHGGAEASLQAAAVYLNRPGLAPLKELIDGAHLTNHVIYRNLLMSLVYNVIAAGLAIGGLINPLIAAVLMPISSLTVLILSFMNRAFQEPYS